MRFTGLNIKKDEKIKDDPQAQHKRVYDEPSVNLESTEFEGVTNRLRKEMG